MKSEFTAVIEHDLNWVIAYCPEIPGANGQDKTKTEALSSLKEAIQLILEDRIFTTDKVCCQTKASFRSIIKDHTTTFINSGMIY